MKKYTQPDEKEYSTGSIMGLTKEDLVVISIALIAAIRFGVMKKLNQLVLINL